MIHVFLYDYGKKNKVILTQIIRESLWDKIRIDEDNRYYFQGVDTINGKVIFLKSFGALIQLDDETNGLIPMTYLQKNKIGNQYFCYHTSIIFYMVTI